MGIDLGRLADEPQIEDALDIAVRISRCPVQLGRADQAGVLAGYANSHAAGIVDRLHDLLVDRARQDHLDDFYRLPVRDAQAIDKLALDLQALQHAGMFQQHHILGEMIRQALVAHGMAAILDDKRLAVITAQVRQCLGQRPCGPQPGLGFFQIER